MIDCVESLHSTGYLHLDIKLDNIMICEDNKVHLIDYGLSQKYKLTDGSHRPDTMDRNFGNKAFASKNAFIP